MLTATEFRKKLYQTLRRVIETGVPVEVMLDDEIVMMLSTRKLKKTSNKSKSGLGKRWKGLVRPGQPLEDIHWDNEWKPTL